MVNEPDGPDTTRPWEKPSTETGAEGDPDTPDTTRGWEKPPTETAAEGDPDTPDSTRGWEKPPTDALDDVDADAPTIPATEPPPGAQGAAASSTIAPQSRYSKRFKAQLGIGAAAAIAVVVVITALWVPGFALTRPLDVHAAQDGVRQVLTDSAPQGYGAKNVTTVVCNDGTNPVIRDGHTFTCAVTINDNTYEVTATFTGNAGSYVVGRPH